MEASQVFHALPQGLAQVHDNGALWHLQDPTLQFSSIRVLEAEAQNNKRSAVTVSRKGGRNKTRAEIAACTMLDLDTYLWLTIARQRVQRCVGRYSRRCTTRHDTTNWSAHAPAPSPHISACNRIRLRLVRRAAPNLASIISCACPCQAHLRLQAH